MTPSPASFLTPDVMWWVLGIILVVYALTGGADFGGGVWELLSGRRHRAEVSAHIAHAIGPIWEANHVWLIFLVVIAFTAFPRAYSVVSVAFHLPLLAALLGIIMRGAAFVFRGYGLGSAEAERRWSLTFAAGSILAPIALGMTLGGMSSGAIVVEGSQVQSVPTAGWATGFGVAVGLFALALFALLAAVHLHHRAHQRGSAVLEAHFRTRAFAAEICAGLLAAIVLWRASVDAPVLFRDLWTSAWTLPLQIATAIFAGIVMVAVWLRRTWLARAAAMVQVALVVGGWGAAMNGAIVLGAVRVENAGTRLETLSAIFWPLIGGAVLLVPALVWLFVVFEGAEKDAPHK